MKTSLVGIIHTLSTFNPPTLSPKGLFGEGACLAVAAGTLSPAGPRRTAVLDPGLPASVGLGISEAPADGDADLVPSGWAIDRVSGGMVRAPSGQPEGDGVGPATPSLGGQVKLPRRGGLRRPNSSSSSRPSSNSEDVGGGIRGMLPPSPSPTSSPPLPSPSSPLVFSSSGVFASGCTGLTLVPEHHSTIGSSGSSGLPASVVAAMSRAMMGHDRFSVMELQVWGAVHRV